MKHTIWIRSAALLLSLAMLLGMTACANTEKDWQEQYDLGMRYLEEGDFEEAILAFSAAIEIDPNRPEAYMGRAEAYIAMDKPREALKDYKKARREAKKDDRFDDLLDELEDLIDELEDWIEEWEEDQTGDENGDGDWTLSDDWNEVVPGEMPEETCRATVSDVYTDYLVDYYGTECCYHIPQIHLPEDRAAGVNSVIYGELMPLVDNNVYYVYPNGGQCVTYRTIRYTWGVKGDLLSVMVAVNNADYEWVTYTPYNISMETGDWVSYEVLLAAYGLDEAGFRDLARSTLEKVVSDYTPEMIEMIGEDFYEYIVTSTLSEENLDLVMPYIGTNGNLCMAACVYSAAGASYYWHTFDLKQQIKLPGAQCTAEHVPQNSGALGYTPEEITEMVAQWYNNNVGGYASGYFTASDQETFLEDGMCYVVVRFANTDPDYTGEANTLEAVAAVDMVTGEIWADGYYVGNLW